MIEPLVSALLPPDAWFLIADPSRVPCEPWPMVHEDAGCPACGCQLGYGSLLDFRPEPPEVPDFRGARIGEAAGIRLPRALMAGSAIPLVAWRDFAARYRCPACVEAEPSEPADVDTLGELPPRVWQG